MEGTNHPDHDLIFILIMPRSLFNGLFNDDADNVVFLSAIKGLVVHFHKVVIERQEGDKKCQ